MFTEPDKVVEAIIKNVNSTLLLGITNFNLTASGMTILEMGISLGRADPALAGILVQWFSEYRDPLHTPEYIALRQKAFAELDRFTTAVLHDVGTIVEARG